MARRRRIRHQGGCLAFTSTACRAITNADASLSPASGSFTFAWWEAANTNDASVSIAAFADYTNAGATAGWLLYRATAAGALQFWIKASGNGVIPNVNATVIADGMWHRFVLVADASTHTIYLYKDNALVAQSAANAWSGSLASTPSALTLGSLASPLLSSALMRVADAVYCVGTAASANDVSADYFDAKDLPGITHRWPLDDGAGSTARATLGGLALTLSGGAVFRADTPCLGRGVARNQAAQSDAMLTGWSQQGMTTGAYAGPFRSDGPQAMTVFSDTNVAGLHSAYLAITNITSSATGDGTSVIFSYFVKSVSGPSPWVTIYLNGGGRLFFNTSTGAFGVTNVAYTNPGAQLDAATGIWRIWVTGPYAGLVWAGIAQSNGVDSYANGGTASSFAIGGAMVEKPVPGQTTPSPYVATGTAPLSVYGKRETRQNLLRQSDKPSDTMYWWLQGAVLTSGKTDPLGGTKAYLVDYTAVAANQGIYQFNAGMGGAQNTKGVWLRGVVGGEQIRLLDSGFTGTTLVVTLTTSWTYYQITDAAGAQPNNAGLWLQKVSGSQFYMAFPRHCIGPDASEYIATTTAPANANGAPRSAS